jgi:hypothetical protein
VLVDADDRAIDQGVLEIRITGQDLEEPLEDAGLCPAAKAPEDRIPGAERLGQITPGRPSAHQPQHRLQEQPIVRAYATGIAGLARE